VELTILEHPGPDLPCVISSDSLANILKGAPHKPTSLFIAFETIFCSNDALSVAVRYAVLIHIPGVPRFVSAVRLAATIDSSWHLLAAKFMTSRQ
jgi:hypothetical protein